VPIWGISGHAYFLKAPQIILKGLPPNENYSVVGLMHGVGV